MTDWQSNCQLDWRFSSIATTILVSLDISAAFETVCHSKLLQRLCDMHYSESSLIYRIKNNLWKWVNTRVCYVRQGSVLGSLHAFCCVRIPSSRRRSQSLNTFSLLCKWYANYCCSEANVNTADALKTVRFWTPAVESSSWFCRNYLLRSSKKIWGDCN